MKESKQKLLMEAFRQCQTLGKQLQLLLPSSIALTDNLETMNQMAVKMKAQTMKILESVNNHQEKRNHLWLLMKEAHQEVLKAKINLRELQGEQCKQQMLVDFDSQLEETDPIIQTLRNQEIQVASLKEEVASKSALHEKMKTAFAHIDAQFNDGAVVSTNGATAIDLATGSTAQ